jgi:hypothetical protein
LRAFGPWSGTTHRVIHRLAALGVIAIQTGPARLFGCEGFVRFTFTVRRWKSGPTRRPSIWRIRARVRSIVAPGQVAFGMVDPPNPRPFIVPEPHGMPQAALGECQRCGAIDRVRVGLFVLDTGRMASGPRCVDHDACDARRARP